MWVVPRLGVSCLTVDFAAGSGPSGVVLQLEGELDVLLAQSAALAGTLFFKNWSSLSPGERYKSWDKKFQLLKSYPNVLISPHSAFLTNEALAGIAEGTVENIKEFQMGSKLTFQVLPK